MSSSSALSTRGSKGGSAKPTTGAAGRGSPRRDPRLRHERRAAPAAARLPAAARCAGLVRHAEREVAHPHHRARGALHRLQNSGIHLRRGWRARRAGHADAVPLADGAARGAGIDGLGTRHVERGRTTLTGRAWSGKGSIEVVEVSTDGGATFNAAVLDPASRPSMWRGWSFTWDATPGEHVLSSRATDSAGNTQPLDPPWNLKGYANNAVERITVQVRLSTAPCASSAASSRPAASTSATTSGPSGVTLEGQERGDPAIYCIVDLHATSVSYDPKALPRATARHDGEAGRGRPRPREGASCSASPTWPSTSSSAGCSPRSLRWAICSA